MSEALLAFLAIIVLLGLGLPVYAAFGIAGTFFLYLENPAFLNTLSTITWELSTSFVMIAILLFVFMGNLLVYTPIAKNMYEAAYKAFGPVRGSLAMATTGACALFGAMSGSAYATIATFGSFAYDEMKNRGYDDSLSLGAIVSGGTLAIIIPPSSMLLFYGALTQESVGDLFMAGVVPGIIAAALFMAYIAYKTMRNPALAPIAPAVPWKQRIKPMVHILPGLALIALVIGSLYKGVATPSEVAGIGCLGAFILALFYWRGIKVKQLYGALLASVTTTSFILLLMLSGKILSLAFASMGFIDSMISSLEQLPDPVVMVVIVGILIILGTFVDQSAITVLCVPLFYPLVKAIGFDPIVFGVIFAFCVNIGGFTPPVCVNCYVLQGVTKAPLHLVIKGALPYVFLTLVPVALLIAFPTISTWWF